jgi:hypothetical protein
MTCDDCRNGLPLYAGRQLPAGEESEIASHLSGCAACRRELEEEIRFARGVHNASVPFREAIAGLEGRLLNPGAAHESRPRRFGDLFRRAAGSRAALLAGLAVCAAAAFMLLLPAPDGGVDHVSSWAVDHYPLIDQTHSLRGSADDVRLWFKDHHRIDVSPPKGLDYSTLTGCKMAEIDAEPAPLLRLEGNDTSAVFMLPTKFRRAAESAGGPLHRDGYTIRLWSEGGYPYLKITRDQPRGA